MFRKLLSSLGLSIGNSHLDLRPDPPLTSAGESEPRYDPLKYERLKFGLEEEEFIWLCQPDIPDLTREEAFRLFVELQSAGTFYEFKEAQWAKLKTLPLESLSIHPGAQEIFACYQRFQAPLEAMPGKAVLDILIYRKCRTDYYRDHTQFSDVVEASQQAALLDVLDRLHTLGAWTLSNDSSKKADTNSFAGYCTWIMRWLMKDGFPGAAGRAGRIFDLLCAGASGDDVIGFKHRDYRPQLGVLSVIHDEWRKGTVLSPDAVAAGRRLVSLMESPPPGKTLRGPEPDDPPVLKGLKEACGLAAQDSYFARMKRAGNYSVYGRLDWFFPDGMPVFWQRVTRETKAMTQEFSDFVTGRAMPAWISDREAFIERGGVLRNEAGASSDRWPPPFGWWNDPPDSDVWQNSRGTPFAFVKANGGAVPEFMSDSELAALWQEATEEERRLPFDASYAEAVDIEAFTFEGQDSDGELFNLIHEMSGGIPSQKWFSRADACLSKIGLDRFRRHAERWIAHLEPLTEAPPRPTKFSFFYHLGQITRYRAGSFEAFPAPGTEDERRFIRRLAYEQAARLCCIQPFNEQLYRWQNDRDRYWRFRPDLSETNEGIACGLAVLLGHTGDEDGTRLLGRLIAHILTGKHGCRSKKVISLACWGLGEIGTPAAIALLGKVRREAADKGLLKQVDKALAVAGKAENLSADDMKDRAMSSHGIGADGTRSVTIEGWTAKLAVLSTRKASLTTISPGGKVTRGLAKSFLALPGAESEAKVLAEAQEDIERILPEARRRLENAFHTQRRWAYPFWQAHIAGNGLLRTMVSRLIWRFESPSGEHFTALPGPDGLMPHDGGLRSIEDKDWAVTLWHPIEASFAETSDWRTALIARRIRQPFLQAWRPVYHLTDAERATGTYSNRFAAHVLEQAPAMAILKARGWKAVNRVVGGNRTDNERVILPLPAFGVAAEFWVAGIGDVMQEIPHVRQTTLYAFITTDRLAFYPLKGGALEASEQPLPIKDVSPMPLTEVMLDLDSVINRTSIGNDRFWQDRGPQAARPVSETVEFIDYRNSYMAGRSPELAVARHAFLSEVLPHLEIGGNCSLQADHLLVDGKYHTYRINLASGAIMIAPELRYLCIVPKGPVQKDSYLPSEEDPMLSLIISKALYLSDEDSIEDPTVRSQLGLAPKAG